MGMTIQDDMWEAAQMLPEKQRAPFVYALVAYGMDGAEPKGSPAWLPVFHVIRDRLRLSAEASERGRRMAMARWGKSDGAEQQHDAQAHARAYAQASGEHMHRHDAENESEKEIGVPPYSPPMHGGDEGAPFWLQCLAAFNDAMGTAYTTMPEKCRHMLERSASTFTAAQVRSMVAFKREEWTGTKYRKGLTPNTLFSPDHFEQYMHQAQAEEKEAERYAEYA